MITHAAQYGVSVWSGAHERAKCEGALNSAYLRGMSIQPSSNPTKMPYLAKVDD